MNIKQIRIGDEISYDCGLGMVNCACVNDIEIRPNMWDEMIPWIQVTFLHNGSLVGEWIPATEEALKNQKVGLPIH